MPSPYVVLAAFYGLAFHKVHLPTKDCRQLILNGDQFKQPRLCVLFEVHQNIDIAIGSKSSRNTDPNTANERI